jgi:hypothetical protein
MVEDLTRHFQEDDHDHSHEEEDDDHEEENDQHEHAEFLSSTLKIVPFLHDRKIYFNRSLATMEYFHFSI